MTIDEAIEQYKHIAVSYEKCGNTEDAMESRQVAEWLRQARGADAASRWYSAKLRDAHRDMRKVMAENAKLRELITDVHEALCSDKAGMFHKLILASMEDDMREMGIEACK